MGGVSNKPSVTANILCYDQGQQVTDLNLNIMKVTTQGPLGRHLHLIINVFQLFILLFFILLDLLYEKDSSR